MTSFIKANDESDGDMTPDVRIKLSARGGGTGGCARASEPLNLS